MGQTRQLVSMIVWTGVLEVNLKSILSSTQELVTLHFFDPFSVAFSIPQSIALEFARYFFAVCFFKATVGVCGMQHISGSNSDITYVFAQVSLRNHNHSPLGPVPASNPRWPRGSRFMSVRHMKTPMIGRNHPWNRAKLWNYPVFPSHSVCWLLGCARFPNLMG